MTGRNRLVLWLATATAAVAAWFAGHLLPWPARLATVFLLVIMPALSLVQLETLRGAAAEQAPRLRIYASSAVAIWFIGGVALLASIASGYTPRILGLVWPGARSFAIWTALTTGSGLALLVGARLFGARENALVDLVIPRSRPERLAFVGLSLSAGLGEELAYRSFLVPALTVASGQIWLGAALAAAAFGMVHAYQGLVGVSRAALLGFVLAIPFIVTGSVLPAMVAHAAVDIISGLWMADWLLRS